MRFVATLLFGWLLTLSAPASAHLMPTQQGTVNLVDDVAYVVVSVPVSALSGDDDRDGLLSGPELQRNHAVLVRRVTQGFRVLDDGVAGVPLMVQLLADVEKPEQNARHLVAMMKLKFAATLADPRVENDLFGSRQDERSLTLRVRRGTQIEPVVLTPLHPGQGLFQPAWRTVAGYVQLGAEHILLGFDHLLFLLTLLVVGAGWRYWLTVVTSFTLAHSLTLTLSLAEVISAPSAIVEPLIAASIVLMALDNLWRGQQPAAQRAGLVFAFGLVHGLGFASSLRGLGGAADSQWMQLLGFNLGVELGQLAFVCACIGVLHALRRLYPMLAQGKLIDGTSVGAAIAGTFMLGSLLIG